MLILDLGIDWMSMTILGNSPVVFAAFRNRGRWSPLPDAAIPTRWRHIMAKKSSSTTKSAQHPRATKKVPAPKSPTSKPKSPGKLSTLDAAAKVLGESKEPLTSKQMIEAMATKGYWTSPGGKTPHATLYAAILREMQAKGKESRFSKSDRGYFTLAKG